MRLLRLLACAMFALVLSLGCDGAGTSAQGTGSTGDVNQMTPDQKSSIEASDAYYDAQTKANKKGR